MKRTKESSGLRHGSLNIEMKDRLCAARALLGQPPPAGVAHACGAVAHHALTHEIHVSVVVSGIGPFGTLAGSSTAARNAARSPARKAASIFLNFSL
jgi:hypothetical protein